MREVLSSLLPWWNQGQSVALATVVDTFHSAPRPAGASMLVGPDGEAVGSVSGGCVEGAVHETGQSVRAGAGPLLTRYGVSDDEAFSVGLTCGGILDVFVERVSQDSFPQLGEVAADVAAERPVAVATVVEHPRPGRVGRRLVVRPGPAGAGDGGLGDPVLDQVVRQEALGMLDAGRTGTVTFGPDGERMGQGMRVFVSSFAPRPRMVVFGAIDFAAAVVKVGALLGYHVTVCDARPVFATHSRFPDADQVIVDWPHRYLEQESAAGRIDERTALCVLTHDPKFDVPLLAVALRLPAVGYIGAMGSRRTHEDRIRRLGEAGVTEAEAARMSSPIGLDLGARTPQETAISIAAEIIALRSGGTGLSLRDGTGPIHAV